MGIVLYRFFSEWAIHVPTSEETDPLAFLGVMVDAAIFTTANHPINVGATKAISIQRGLIHDHLKHFTILSEEDIEVHSVFDGRLIPLIMVEHVKSYEKRGAHLDHLSVAMKSALGILRARVMEEVVVGLLCDRNLATVVVGWNEDEEVSGPSLIQENSPLTTDLADYGIGTPGT